SVHANDRGRPPTGDAAHSGAQPTRGRGLARGAQGSSLTARSDPGQPRPTPDERRQADFRAAFFAGCAFFAAVFLAACSAAFFAAVFFGAAFLAGSAFAGAAFFWADFAAPIGVGSPSPRAARARSTEARRAAMRSTAAVGAGSSSAGATISRPATFASMTS